MKLVWCTVVLLCLVSLVASKKTSRSGITIDALGQSGKIRVSPGSDATDEGNKKTIVISFDSLKEVDNKGNEVGKTRSVKHSINTFATQAFVFSDVKEDTLQNVKVSTFSMESNLTGLTSNMKVLMYIVKEDGNITLAGENQQVKKGQMKFSIELSNWDWCSPCKSGEQDGAFVDLMISLKTPGTVARKDKNNRKTKDDLEEYAIGDGNDIRVSKKVLETKNDGTSSAVLMAAGYPKFEKKGSMKQFTFRFAKFEDKALYDPTLALAALGTSGTAKILVCPMMIFIATLLAFWIKL